LYFFFFPQILIIFNPISFSVHFLLYFLLHFIVCDSVLIDGNFLLQIRVSESSVNILDSVSLSICEFDQLVPVFDAESLIGVSALVQALDDCVCQRILHLAAFAS